MEISLTKSGYMHADTITADIIFEKISNCRSPLRRAFLGLFFTFSRRKKSRASSEHRRRLFTHRRLQVLSVRIILFPSPAHIFRAWLNGNSIKLISFRFVTAITALRMTEKTWGASIYRKPQRIVQAKTITFTLPTAQCLPTTS